MVRVIHTGRPPLVVITIGQNNLFYSEGSVPYASEGLFLMDTINNGMHRIRARKDLILVVEGLWSNPCTGAQRILFIREDRTREGMNALMFANPAVKPILRQALIDVALPCCEAVGGLDRALVYDDEIVVIDAMGRSFGWIIKREDIVRYYEQANSLNLEREELERVRVRHEIHVDQKNETFAVVRIEGWSDPQLDRDPTLQGVREYTVLYGKKSRMIYRILLTNTDVEALSCDRPPLRSLAIGKKLPECLGTSTKK